MRIKELREINGFSQKKLSEMIKTSQRNISRWENEENEPTYSQLIKIADIFKVSIDYLVEREDDTGNIIIKTEKQKLTHKEERLLQLFNQLDNDEQNKIIEDTEYFANKKLKKSTKGA